MGDLPKMLRETIYLGGTHFCQWNLTLGYVKKIRAAIGTPDRRHLEEFDFLADSGSWYMVLNPELVKKLRLSPVATRTIVLADGREIEVELVVVYVRAFDRDTVTLAVISNTPELLFGTSTMEDLGISLDPVSGEAKPVRRAGLML